MSGCGGCGAESVGDCACDARLFVVDDGDGESDPVGVAELGELAEDVVAEVDALEVGGVAEVVGPDPIGRGAAPIWRVRRVA